MNKKLILLLALILLTLALSQLSSAIVINDISSEILHPGKQGELSIVLKNDFNFDIQDVSVSLDLTNTPLSTIGSSEDTVDEIREDDKETFSFTLVANSDAKVGDYNIPYVINYSSGTAKKGTIGVKVRSETNIDYIASFDNPVVGEKSKLNLKIVNKGLSEARFVSIKLNPLGYTLLSEREIYIGNIASDDFETATFDVLIKSRNPSLQATIEYQDLDSKKYSQDIDLELKAYSEEQAIELGIKQKNNTPIYITLIVLLIIIWLIVRYIRKAAKKRKSLNRES